MMKYLATTILVLAFPMALFSADCPNIVFILADDLGWSDTTLYGTTKFFQTPNIERLATPACHLPRIVLEATPGKSAPPSNKAVPVKSATRLKTEFYTLAEALKDAGYATGHFGKWHLGHESYSPLEHGFDVDVPHWPGPGPAGSYVAPWKFPDFDPDTLNEHIEDRMAKEAAAFMEEHKDEPFFLNYWMFSVHAPFDAKKSLIEKHRVRVNPGDPQRSPTYAAMIESMDDAVGTLLGTLDRLGIAEKTIAVFTYFPHTPKVPDWLPPAASVRRGNWKLIRIFHGGENGRHRWKLFNLRNDIGEKNHLAAEEPQRVKELDTLIETFLVDTKAVRPVPNPDFNPAAYRAEDEGKPRLRNPRNPAPSTNKRKPTGKPIAGWRPEKDCALAIKDGSLLIKSSGRDPHLSFVLPESLPAGELELHVMIASRAGGRGQFFWQEEGVTPVFSRERSVTFNMTHDGDAREHRIAFRAQHAVTAVRLDPGQAAGEVRVSSMKLIDTGGKTLHQWTLGRK